jgi:hypothetical protein
MQVIFALGMLLFYWRITSDSLPHSPRLVQHLDTTIHQAIILFFNRSFGATLLHFCVVMVFWGFDDFYWDLVCGF